MARDDEEGPDLGPISPQEAYDQIRALLHASESQQDEQEEQNRRALEGACTALGVALGIVSRIPEVTPNHDAETDDGDSTEEPARVLSMDDARDRLKPRGSDG